MTPLVETINTVQKVVLIGASNLGNCSENFRQSGLEEIDLTVPGWLATPKNVNDVVEQLTNIDISSGCKLIIDPFSN
jgi:hypothetical protein